MATYADNVLFYITKPELSLPNLLKALEYYGRLPNYKESLGTSEALNVLYLFQCIESKQLN